jgi:hypothetical protein
MGLEPFGLYSPRHETGDRVMNITDEARNTLIELFNQLTQESNGLQIIGQALSPDQLARVEELQRFIEAIRRILEDHQPSVTPDSSILIDGRYEGGNHELFIELRIDEAVSGVISADLFRNGSTGRSFVASIRTTPGVSIQRNEGSWPIIGSDDEDRTATGQLTLTPQADDGSVLTGVLLLDKALTGLPVRTEIHFAADFSSAQLRRLGIELEQEEGVGDLPSFEFDGTDVTVQSSFEAAGFEISNVGQSTVIPTPSQNWGTAQLHGLMVDLAQAQLTRPAWELHLLNLSESTRNGLLGIMFDSGGPLPRQGTAVFTTEIDNFTTDSHFPRKLIQTTVHELGHALNLAHRFEREVGRADSLSFMNYDWRYRGGNRQTEYWSNFSFTFDDDELEFMRHAPRNLLIPGGAAFHSVNYWSDGNGGYSPYVPEVPINFLELTLQPPASGANFDFAQPVFLEIELKNLSDQTFDFTPEILDPKSGFLEVLIRRRDSDGPADHFRPIAERCFDIAPERMLDLAPNDTINNNLNLTFGSAGFSFAEPGEYDVTALLVFFNRQNEEDLIVTSNTLRIRVRFPHSVEEENDAEVLHREDVGTYFALGGSRVMPEASDDLEKIRLRRQGKQKTIKDPIVANIVRCAGIDAGRSYERYLDRKFKHSKADKAKAAGLLKELTPGLLKNTFDAHTARCTAELAQKYYKAANGKAGK